MPDVKICDLTLRDGMQAVNRSATIPLELRLRLARALQRAGLPYIELGSFVNPRIIPAMRDTAELFAALGRSPDHELAALVPTMRYYQQARESARLDTVALLVSASDNYAMVNTRMTRDQALASAAEVAEAARRDGFGVRAYLSYAFRRMDADGGEMPARRVDELCRQLIEVGCETVALSDTDGRATPGDVERIVGHLEKGGALDAVAVHLHDRYGLGLVNALTAYRLGVRTFDCTVGGVGGNKLLKDSVGNIATEELVYMFECLGVDTGVDLEALLDAGAILLEAVRFVDDPPPPSKILADRLGRGESSSEPARAES